MKSIEFVIKDKFSYIYGGYDQFYIIDNNDKMYNIDKLDPKSIYLWKISLSGDKISARIIGESQNRIIIERIN